MILGLIAALALMGTAVAQILRAFGMGRLKMVRSISQIDAYGYTAAAPAPAPGGGAAKGLLDGVAGVIGHAVGARLTGLKEAEIRQALMGAGMYGLTPRRFIGYRVLSAVSVTIVLGWLLASIGWPIVLVLLVGLVGALAGWATPMVIVRSRTERRWAKVEEELPELIDLLVVTVEAGMGFSGSLNVASTRTTGPLGDELRLAMQEQTMGLSVEDSLRNMLERCETPAMRAFVRSVLQGETLGVSIGQIMRNLSEEMRKRRKAHAEEKAQRAPIKLLFPLIFMIFPAMFIVLLGPAIFSVIDSFGAGGR
jgi:tight adherence protein C